MFNLQSFEVLKDIVLQERYSKELEINFKYSQYGIHLFTILLIDPSSVLLVSYEFSKSTCASPYSVQTFSPQCTNPVKSATSQLHHP